MPFPYIKGIHKPNQMCDSLFKAVHQETAIMRQTMKRGKRAPMGVILYFTGVLLLGLYFTFAAVQGDFGVFKRAEIEAEGRALTIELAELQAKVDRMENLTRRLSDNYLDLDLLDEQARDMLGMIRADEIVIR